MLGRELQESLRLFALRPIPALLRLPLKVFEALVQQELAVCANRLRPPARGCYAQAKPALPVQWVWLTR
jgi:hypothetical protein